MCSVLPGRGFRRGTSAGEAATRPSIWGRGPSICLHGMLQLRFNFRSYVQVLFLGRCRSATIRCTRQCNYLLWLLWEPQKSRVIWLLQRHRWKYHENASGPQMYRLDSAAPRKSPSSHVHKWQRLTALAVRSQTRHLCGVSSLGPRLAPLKSPCCWRRTPSKVCQWVILINKPWSTPAWKMRLSDMSAVAQEAGLNMNTAAVITHHNVVAA